MKPDETNTIPEKKPNNQSQEAAARIVRSQIDDLYIANQTTAQSETINPYFKTHTEQTDIQTDQWKKYHTSWQSYYQKYYEGYYTHHLKKAQHALEQQVGNSQTQNKQSYFSHRSSNQPESDNLQPVDDAIFDLRQKLIGKVQESASSIRNSHHFMPIVSGLIVVIIFLFLQYNRVLVSNVMSYISPGNINLQNIVINPINDITVGPEPRLIIPKINVDVPVIYDIGNDYVSQMAAMNKGVAHFAIPGASSHPGQIGNTVLAGHSSSDLLDSGDYKFIFVQLDKLVVGDTVYANYQQKRYTYTITNKEVVKPTEVSKLSYPTTKPVLTLITCTPLGTALNRLLITAEQISPDPDSSKQAPAKKVGSESIDTSIPGNSPTLLERVFDIFG